MKRALTYSLLLILITVVIVSINPHGKKPTHPNIVVILTDDQGYGDVGFNGNLMIHTPTLDSLAKTGVVIDRFYTSPICGPSRTSILTGDYAFGNNGKGQKATMNAEVTLAEILKKNNYQTAYFGKWSSTFKTSDNPMNHGFDYSFGFCGDQLSSNFDAPLEHNNKPVQTNGFVTDVITDSVVAFINRQHTPFLTFIAYNTPHLPYEAPEYLVQKYKNLNLDENTAFIYGMCENIDYNVNRIIRNLTEQEKINATIIVFLSDNGPEFLRFNSGLKGRKSQVDEGGLRVPFVISYPNGGFMKRRITLGFAAHIDLLPTLLNLANLPFDSLQFDGINFAEILKDSSEHFPDRTFFSNLGDSLFSKTPGAVRTDSFLLTLTNEDTLLFNLYSDKFQRTDIKKDFPKILEWMLSDYEVWINQSKSGEKLVRKQGILQSKF